MIAEQIEFNGEWHKDCHTCKAAFGASTLDGLAKFFYRNRTAKDGLTSWCKDCVRERQHGRKRKPEHIKRRNAVIHRSNPIKTKARAKLKYAVSSGKITRPSSCEICNSTEHIHGHHDDYSKPLDVRWVCRKCHLAIHNKSRKEHPILSAKAAEVVK